MLVNQDAETGMSLISMETDMGATCRPRIPLVDTNSSHGGKCEVTVFGEKT